MPSRSVRPLAHGTVSRNSTRDRSLDRSRRLVTNRSYPAAGPLVASGLRALWCHLCVVLQETRLQSSHDRLYWYSLEPLKTDRPSPSRRRLHDLPGAPRDVDGASDSRGRWGQQQSPPGDNRSRSLVSEAHMAERGASSVEPNPIQRADSGPLVAPYGRDTADITDPGRSSTVEKSAPSPATSYTVRAHEWHL